MSTHSLGTVEPSFLVYLVAFGAAAAACVGSAARARRVDDPDTRRGLVGLLLASGGWAAAQVAYLLAPTPALKTGFYLFGLVVGFATLGPWLYFCSAYTGRSLHRYRTIRRAAVAAFAAVVLVKLTNPLHHRYFTAEVVAAPFPHLAVHHGLAHWLVMGLSYALATVGYFMLLELFVQVDYDTRPFVALVSITALPVVFDAVALASPSVLDIPYEPLGVAVFAVGVCYVYFERFQAIQAAGGSNEPVVVLDGDDRIRDYNDSAARLFPELRDADAVGAPFRSVLPALADALRSDARPLEIDREGERRYYRLTETPFGADGTRFGRVLTLTDVSHRERNRRELERKNRRLERFANVVSHDLRNPLNVAAGRLELAREERDSEHLAAVARAHDRMEALVDDLLALARQGRPIDEVERVTLSALARECWRLVETADAELVVERDLTLSADGDRLRQLLENLFRNAVEHGSPGDRTESGDAVEHGSADSRKPADETRTNGGGLTVRVGAIAGADGFYVEDDGVGIPADERPSVLESGYTTERDGTGFGLAIVAEIAHAHGWDVRVTESRDGGARFEFTGVTVA